VTLSGTNLDGVTSVTFGGTAGTNITANTSASVAVTAPRTWPAPWDVIVTATAGSATAPSGFTYVPAATATITSIAPVAGKHGRGTNVTINGTLFTGATAVTFGGVTATFTVVSGTRITATTPPHCGGSGGCLGGHARQRHPDGNAGFTYQAAAPTVTQDSAGDRSTSGVCGHADRPQTCSTRR